MCVELEPLLSAIFHMRVICLLNIIDRKGSERADQEVEVLRLVWPGVLVVCGCVCTSAPFPVVFPFHAYILLSLALFHKPMQTYTINNIMHQHDGKNCRSTNFILYYFIPFCFCFFFTSDTFTPSAAERRQRCHTMVKAPGKSKELVNQFSAQFILFCLFCLSVSLFLWCRFGLRSVVVLLLRTRTSDSVHIICSADAFALRAIFITNRSVRSDISANWLL